MLVLKQSGARAQAKRCSCSSKAVLVLKQSGARAQAKRCSCSSKAVLVLSEAVLVIEKDGKNCVN